MAAKMSQAEGFDETWDEDEVASFLKREGIPEEYADSFKGKFYGHVVLFNKIMPGNQLRNDDCHLKLEFFFMSTGTIRYR